MSFIGHSLRKITSLEDLSLSFQWDEQEYPKEGAQTLGKRIKSLKNLKTFKTMNGMVESFGQKFKYLACLKEISLTDERGPLALQSMGMQSLSQGLKRTRVIEKLFLDVGCLRYTDNSSIKSLVQCLKGLVSLKSLDLYFYDFPLSCFEAFAESIGKLVCLRELKVSIIR